jgi:phage gp36-like protein
MAWITLTDADLETRFAGAELAALRQKALSSGQGDPVPVVLAEVVDLVRGYVAGHQVNQLGVGATVPAKLKTAALSIVRYELLNRLGMRVSEDRKQAYLDAIRLLEQVARGQFAVDEPVEAEVGDFGAPLPRVRERAQPRRLP